MHNNIKVKGKLVINLPLADFTSWHVGGVGDLVFFPSDLADLVNFLHQIPADLPLTWLGLGSNVLIRDGGIRGAVIITSGLNQIEITENNIMAQAGVPCPKFAKLTAKKNLTGAEFFAGIPGTIGGALRMNAGAFGGETWNIVTKVIMINRSGELIEHQKAEFITEYRSVVQPESAKAEWFVAGYFSLGAANNPNSTNNIDGQQKIAALLKKRAEQQPIGSFNCGSVFRNPPTNFAAKLIEDAGLKGYYIGAAQVSPKHANFIINNKTATAKDIENLIIYVHNKIRDKFDINLIPEVHVIGEFL